MRWPTWAAVDLAAAASTSTLEAVSPALEVAPASALAAVKNA